MLYQARSFYGADSCSLNGFRCFVHFAGSAFPLIVLLFCRGKLAIMVLLDVRYTILHFAWLLLRQSY